MATKKAKTKKAATKRGSKRGAPAPKAKVTQKERDALLALDAALDTKPDVAVKILLDEARDLAKASANDSAALLRGTELRAGFGKELGKHADLLDRAEDDWSADRARRATTAVKNARKDAETQKRGAMRALRYFLRGDAETQARLDEIAEGSGDADLVDDCNRLATLVAASASSLSKAKLGANPEAKLRAAAAKLAEVTSEQASDTAPGDSIAVRNRAFWQLRNAMDAIRAAGRYVFADDARRLAKYRSTLTYARARTRTRKRPTAPVAPPTPSA
ncbi:MAG: hypothetical protein IT379_10760 [Deltaproteobacteria bacterium]|nr:hypothetical protein [Deltaproteobacteria bacterium]